ncbi:MAG TPA: hypothetical protein DHV62_09540 [Elusimicrobia bacterium]|jgi:predicted HAD superfamily phosphohydrolase|nr:hypothetical protein [Elusimicrobiota bacterium]
MKYFFTDCEGPLTKNDNAYELTACFLPWGEKLFRQLSVYDDILAYLVKKPGYNAGGTLKLILPFFKAYDLNNQEIEKFSQKNFLFVPHIIETLNFLQKIMPCFIVSTSYRPYIHALCKTINFPEKNTYATEIDLDKLKIGVKEKIKLKNYAQEIINLPELELSAGVKKFSQLPDRVKKSVQRLNKIFWEEMNNLRSNKFFEIIRPVGGEEKAEAILSQLGGRKELLENVVYVGDSITDRQAFQVVRKNGGLTISFNGNRYAIESAEIAVISRSAYILGLLSALFVHFGKEKVLELSKKFALAQVVNQTNRKEIIQKSEIFRKRFRGERIGQLG